MKSRDTAIFTMALCIFILASCEPPEPVIEECSEWTAAMTNDGIVWAKVCSCPMPKGEGCIPDDSMPPDPAFSNT